MLASSKIVGFVPTLIPRERANFTKANLVLICQRRPIRSGDDGRRHDDPHLQSPKDFTPVAFTVLGWEAQEYRSAGRVA